jgi:hypothetical protein
VLYVAFFLFGAGETLADSTSVALLPSIVPAQGLARANARLLGTYLVGNQLVAPSFGAWLFVVAAPLPFAFDAASFLATRPAARAAADAQSSGCPTRHPIPWHPKRPRPTGRPRGGPIGPHPARWTPAVTWPVALRRVRAWLTPWLLLQRCWRAWPTSPPVQAMLDWVAAGRPLYLYLPP